MLTHNLYVLQGEASGIKLASLLKLSAVKTMDRKRTLLHIFADFCDKVCVINYQLMIEMRILVKKSKLLYSE